MSKPLAPFWTPSELQALKHGGDTLFTETVGIRILPEDNYLGWEDTLISFLGGR